MALLVHYSFPDESEAANGVAAVRNSSFGSVSVEIDMVSQKGAVSVTNLRRSTGSGGDDIYRGNSNFEG